MALDGSGSDPNNLGQTLSYYWSQIAGAPIVPLTGETTATPGFTAPVLATGADNLSLTFQLIVNDGTDDSPVDPVVITVIAPPDVTSPTVVLSGAPTSVTGVTSFDLDIAFSEDVTGFEQGDINVAGATVTGFTGTGATYRAEITPIAGFEITISVAAGAAQDASANPNVASNVLSISSVSKTETEQFVSDAMQSRATALISVQPKIGRFLLGGQSDSFNVSTKQGAGSFNFTTSSDRPLWMVGQGRWVTDGELETSYGNLAIGGHVSVRENVLLGVMTQFDKSVSDEDDASFESTGWLVGTYAVARLPEQPLVFSASYLVGQTYNTVSPLGTYEDNFNTDRSILTLGIAGELELTGVTLIPAFDLAHVIDESEAYIDGDSNPVRAQLVTMTDASLGLDFVVPLNDGVLDVIGGIGATMSRVDDSFEEVVNTRGNIELGLRYQMSHQGLITGLVTYDGLGQDDFEVIGAAARVEFKF